MGSASTVLACLQPLLLAASCVGGVALLFQALLAIQARRAGVPERRSTPAVSILKPLCGADDDLWENLMVFSALAYPDYEVLLGVRDLADAAWPVAERAVRTWPGRFRLVVQSGSAGHNPKVNQLVSLAAEARGELLVVSDSNTRVPLNYLDDTVARFEEARVGCVTHPVVGVGERTLGALMDNLNLGASIGPGMMAVGALGAPPCVVGKSMALRRGALAQIGGFEAFADVLAEDHVIGNQVRAAGLEVVVSNLPVLNVSRDKSVPEFVSRYARWWVLSRASVRPWTYLGHGLLNPLPWALLGWAVAPSWPLFVALSCAGCLKAALDVWVASQLRAIPWGAGALPAVLLKDALLFGGWCWGLVSKTVTWRGTRLRVGRGTRLERRAVA